MCYWSLDLWSSALLKYNWDIEGRGRGLKAFNTFKIINEQLILFFFSSRRRLTSCSRDWSSDVCSSDLCDSVLFDSVLSFVLVCSLLFCSGLVWPGLVCFVLFWFGLPVLFCLFCSVLFCSWVIGRASCRDRGCTWVVGVLMKYKKLSWVGKHDQMLVTLACI